MLFCIKKKIELLFSPVSLLTVLKDSYCSTSQSSTLKTHSYILLNSVVGPNQLELFTFGLRDLDGIAQKVYIPLSVISLFFDLQVFPL
jgi:hypothetical protein